ncbi:uncharacterized protein LOC124288568 [Haliotis rubra]|uniref:uncharacterized protein LOC124288568 n=1 Tax=Haliotis rubra TaxID=36100 RepID=UPI001EE4EF5E|nr:uncharacterized protein LOC124288568 [Haliotis rubra]
MNWMYILIITCSIGGGIILILAVAVIYCCLRRRKGPKTDRSLLDGYSEGGHDISLQDFNQRRSLINPRFKTGYTNMAHSNEGYQPDGYDPYSYQSENRSWLHSVEAQSAMEKQHRAEKGFQSGFPSIDSDRSFSIKRPQVSPRAVGDEQL